MSNKKINYHRYDLNEFKSIIPIMITNPIEANKQYETYIKNIQKIILHTHIMLPL